MILYTKKKLVIPLGLNPNYNQDDKDPLQDKTVDSSTQFQSIYPDAGYSGMSRIDINPYVLDSSSAILTSNGDYEFTSDKDGLSRVDVKVNFDTEPIYNEGYAKGKSDQKSLLTEISITENGTYTREDGYSKVNVDVLTVNNQEKIVKSSTLLQEVTPDSGYTGLNKVTVEPYKVESVTVSPKVEKQIVTPLNADALSDVTVNPVTSDIDSNIVPGNIKKDIEILGVTGTFEGGEPEPRAIPVSYISNENDGSLVFDTNYIPNENTRIIAKVAFGGQGTPGSGWGNFWGSHEMFAFREWNGYPSNNFGVQINRTPKTLPNTIADAANGNLDEFLDIDMENYKLTIGDRFVASPKESFTISHSMFLFGASNPDTGELTERSSRLMRISSFSIFEGNDLVKNLIPYKDIDGKGCLYDTSTESFIYPLQGTPTLGEEIKYQEKRVSASLSDVIVTADPGFEALSEVIVNGVTDSVDPNIVPENIKNGVEILGVAGSYTGSIFYRCGYVSNNASNKSIYRDTGIVPTQNTRVEAVLSFEDINTGAGGYGYFFGVTGESRSYIVFDCREQGGYGRRNVSCIFDRAEGKIPSIVMSSAPMKICMGQIEGEYSYMSVNGYIFKDAPKDLVFSSENTIYIWASNYNGRVDEYTSRVMRVYDFKIFEGDSLVFHGVPAVDNEGAATFIDLVTNTVVPGEGTLTGGGVYVEPDEESYIENGTYDGNLSDVYFNLGSGSNFYNTSRKTGDIDKMSQYSEIIASVPETKSDTNSPCLYGVSDPNNFSGYLLSLNGTAVNACAGNTAGTAYGDKEVPKGVNNLTINTFRINSNTYPYAYTGCSVNTTGVELRSNEGNYKEPLSDDVYLFSANNVSNPNSTMFRCLKGSKIYQFKYFNLSDKEVHILIPDFYNNQYCFKDALTGDRIYAASGTPTGNISQNFKTNNGAVIVETPSN